MTEKLLTTVPFSGFYYSLHDQELDFTLRRTFEDDQGHMDDVSEAMHDRAFDGIDWSVVHEAYAKEYTECLADVLDLTLEFDELNSPKYYNYSTDRIFAYIPIEQVRMMRWTLSDQKIDVAIRVRFTSRDGFASHYANTLSEWPVSLADWDHNQVGLLLDLWAARWAESEHSGHDGFDAMAEYYIMEDSYGNGVVDDCLSCGANAEASRMFNMAYDWRVRKERRAAKFGKNSWDYDATFTWEDWLSWLRSQNLPFEKTPLGAAMQAD